MGAKKSVVGVAIDDGVGNIGLGLHYFGQKELDRIGVFNPLPTDVGGANAVDIATCSTVDIVVGLGEILLGLGGRAG